MKQRVMAEIEERAARSHAAVRELLADKPEALAEYDAKMAELGVR